MKKHSLLFLFLFSILGFSQDKKAKIQDYLNKNNDKFALSQGDINDWFIESDGNSEVTKINNYYIKQRYQEIEIYNAISNVWVKNDEVINVVNRFIPNISQKINTTTPTLSVMQALDKAFSIVNETNKNNQIIETIGSHEYKISNGTLTEDPISAELVFQSVGDKLNLAWDFTFYTIEHNHLWSMRIDAVNGKLLQKKDWVLSCNFKKEETNSSNNFSFYKNFFKSENIYAPLQVLGGSYKVVPFNYESPNHIARQLITNPENITASPKGWHNANTMTGTTASLIYNYTRGNNVWARSDFTGSNPTNPSTVITANGYAPSSSGLIFDYPYPGTDVAAKTYIDASVTNLFYMNNICHDIWYQYGFNEENGNFQQSNYNYGASGADYVYADAQDSSISSSPSLNNANFSAPTDGNKGRMQMYVWNIGPDALYINSPVDILGTMHSIDNSFSPGHIALPVAPSMIQTDLVLFNDGSQDVGQTDNADACSVAVNASAISGHIAVIRRSTSIANGGNPCTFIEKVKNAQNAGAVAVIMVNNDLDNPDSVIGMSGADSTITIPAIGVSSNNGEILISDLKNGIIVNAKIQLNTPFVASDGDLDNGVISHEFGHGISIRLTGGRNNSGCLDNNDEAGEGWSDWFALMLQLKPGDEGTDKRGIGTFVFNQPTNGDGIRDYAYSTNMSINPMTYGYTNNYQYFDTTGNEQTEIHGTGSVWATILWDLTWAYIAKYGYDDNKYSGTGGNNKVMQLVIDALKLQPCSPSFIDSRDALLQADLATTNGQDYCLIWQVFAHRGMGVNASAGDTNVGNDQIEDFTEPTIGTTPDTGSNCVLSINYFENLDMIKVYPNPSKGFLHIHINQFVGKVNIQVVDINGRTVLNNSNIDFNIEKTLDLNAIQSGVYFLRINGDNLNFSQKIIKN